MAVPKPGKPWPDFPLFAHCNGQWARKVNGRLIYYGPWADVEGALKRFHTHADGTSPSLKDAVDKYLTSRRLLQESGEITLHHLGAIEWTLTDLSTTIGPARTVKGLGSEDYGVWRAHLAKTNGPGSMHGYIARVRAFLNWCVREGILSAIPPFDSLKKPSRNQLRRARAAKGSRMFAPVELRRLMACAGPEFRAMILLALNAGLGNGDLAQLKTSHIQGVWLDYSRPKTGIERRVPLWPETREALAALKRRPDDDLVFRTKYGNAWESKGKTGASSPIGQKFTKLCQGVNVYKPGRGFYSLRHICQTIGEEAGDKAAIEYILGHAPPAEDMASVYRERMAPKRLFKVCRHIRKWLGIAKKKPAKPAKETAKQVARATRKPKPEPAKQVAGPTRKPAKQVTACPALQIAASRATTVPVV